MKEHYVKDLVPNEKIVSFFLVQTKEVRYKKTSGDPFLSLTLCDATGRIESKMWDNVEEVMDTFDRDDFVKVKAAVQLYRDQPQLVIQKIRKAEESELDLGDFVPHTGRDIDEMVAELRTAIEAFENEHLKALCLAFLDDPDIGGRLRRAPAAKALHHATVGGLLEHVCSLMKLARLVSSNYDFVDAELVQTGVLLHDLGKLDELTYERAFGYSSEGQLLGHITICIQWIDQKCRALPDFPHELKRVVEHMVLSHHGRYEFGSPKLPMFPEAAVLSYIDDLDSKLEAMRASLSTEVGSDPNWTRYNPALERPVLNVGRYLGRDAAEAPAPPPELPEPTEKAAPAQAEKAPENRSLFAEKLGAALSDE